ncbi:hypothetical protein OIU76_009466 [Salix suchowensis]|uniref:Uncharacterized protein n=1 Tax=Salix suchowensis TaxID=1278906 RepID=A0ABQ9BF00_9ROSI|nr:hypothetical protein OIU76_009466 [Salix suchowensis]KAJ6382090.1 hypothetical protein OIU77_030695 [Salix suchowensis]
MSRECCQLCFPLSQDTYLEANILYFGRNRGYNAAV